jgi:hypothetical protein
MYAGLVAAANERAIHATRASGVIVTVHPESFEAVLQREPAPLVIYCRRRFLFGDAKHDYLTVHKGIAFFTRAAEPLSLPEAVELVSASSMWVP